MTPETRDAVLIRDRYRCVRCGSDLANCRYSVHHRKLRSQGGTDDLPNVILLCGSGTDGCHHLVHSRRKEVGEPGGYIVPRHEDPAAVPVVYHRRGATLLV